MLKFGNGLVIIFIKLFKFGIIGFTGLVIDFGITWLFKEKFCVHYLLANFMGFSLAVISNFFFNSIWTFKDDSANLPKKMVLFLAISLTGLLINTLILHLLVRSFFLDFYLAKFIAVVVVFIWNFAGNYFITFKSVAACNNDTVKSLGKEID